MKLAYTAIDQRGQVMNDVIDAQDTIAATEVLHRKGLFVSQIDPVDKSNTTQKHPTFSLDKLPGRKLKQLAELMRYLHVLLRSGSSVTQVNINYTTLPNAQMAFLIIYINTYTPYTTARFAIMLTAVEMHMAPIQQMTNLFFHVPDFIWISDL